LAEVADQVKGHSQRYYILEKEQAKKAHVPHTVNPGHGNNRTGVVMTIVLVIKNMSATMSPPMIPALDFT
jgi:hypothetical protein